MYHFRYQQKKKPLRYYIGWSIIPIILGIILVSFITGDFNKGVTFVQNTIEQRGEILGQIKKRDTISVGEKRDIDYFQGVSIQDILRGGDRYIVDKDAALPEVDAFAYVVGDVLTGEIIFEKNADEILPIASVTKLMTASVALDEIPETKETIVSAAALATEGNRGMLRVNEKLQVSDLLYPLLLVSSNDASEVLAETLGRKTFIQNMNRQAFDLGMTKTTFDDPSGLSEKNTSTARDLFKLSSYLYNRHNIVFEISKLKQYSQGGRTWTNANRFAGAENYEGGKTGYTSKAKRTGVAMFSVPFEGYGDRVVAITILRTDNRAEDYSKLLSFLNNHVQYSIGTPQKINEHTEDSVTLSFVGDMMFDRGVRSSVEKNFGGDYSKLFENLSILSKSDIAFANLEGPISDKGKNVGSKYSFRFDPKIAEVLKKSGIDIVSFANNHVGDWSVDAFNDTLSYLQDNAVLFTGAGKTKSEASQVTILESKGIKIGFLGFTDVGPAWMEATETNSGILLASDPNRLSFIENAKNKVDILIVSYHWGDEYKPHNQRQEELAKSSIDAGADIIIGHHPHVQQDIEEYRDGLIVYSLGNAIFDQHFSKETMEGMLMSISVNKDGIVDYEPFIFSLNEKYQPETPISQKILDTGEILENFDSKDTVSISWVGDIIPGNPKKENLKDSNELFENAQSWIQKADIAIGNLEGVITSKEYSKCAKLLSENCFAFKADESFAETLRFAGFDILNIANNHSFDFGVEGFEDTIQALDSKNLTSVGAKDSITYYQEKGIKIGLVSFTHDGRLNSIQDTKKIESLIKEASKNSNITLAIFHGGAEGSNHQTTPNKTEIFLGENRGNLVAAAQIAIESGADAVFGSGPHVVRGIQFYKEKPIVYSAGNFAGYNTLFLDENTRKGLGVLFNFSKDGAFVSGDAQFFDLGTNGIPKLTREKSFAHKFNSLSRQNFKDTSALIDETGSIIFNEHQAIFEGFLVTNQNCPQASGESSIETSWFGLSKQKTLSQSFVPKRLIEIPKQAQYGGRTICAEEETVDAFNKMLTAANKENISLVATSGFRDFDTQESLYEEWRRQNPTQKLLAVAPAGHSEHQLGTTLDLSSKEINFESATKAFETTKTYQWLTDNAANFGFVQSFIPGSEDTTGYIPESWHWRYVGVDHALAIKALNISTLEYFAK